MLRCEFRIRDVAIGTIHLIREPLNSRKSIRSIKSKVIIFFDFRDFRLYGLYRLCSIDTEFFEFSQNFDDVFFQSSQFFFLDSDTIIDAVDVERKIFSRYIRCLEIEILYGFQVSGFKFQVFILFYLLLSFVFFFAPCILFPAPCYQEVTRESFSLLHFIPILFDKFREVFFFFEASGFLQKIYFLTHIIGFDFFHDLLDGLRLDFFPAVVTIAITKFRIQ